MWRSRLKLFSRITVVDLIGADVWLFCTEGVTVLEIHPVMFSLGNTRMLHGAKAVL